MPNWCVGILKVRGKKEDIKRFLIEGLEPVGWIGISGESTVEETDYSTTIRCSENSNMFLIKGTHRQFIATKEIEWCHENESEEMILVLENFEGAWAIDYNGLSEVSQRFNIDFKIHGFERGMEFNQLVEIHKGKLIQNDEIKFTNYEWECINPTLGG